MLPQGKNAKRSGFFLFKLKNNMWRNSVNHHGVAGIFTDFSKIFKFPKMIHLDLRIFFLQRGGGFHHQSHQCWGKVFTPVFTPRVASIRSISAGCWSTSTGFATWILKIRLGERVLFPPKTNMEAENGPVEKGDSELGKPSETSGSNVLFSGEDNRFILVLGG